MKISISVAAGAALLAVSVAAAAATPSMIEQRQALLKQMGGASKEPVAMMKGQAPFDAAKVHAALATYQKNAAALPKLFPAPPAAGEKTDALPAIWKDKAKFTAGFAKLAADAKAADAAITDEASFKANYGKVLADCGACHDNFKAKK